jgi:hypothetical protein
MIDFTTELETLEVVRRIEQALQEQPFIEVSERADVGIRNRGNVPCKCGVYFIYRRLATLPNQQDWELRYIGVHKSVRQRLNEHLFYAPDTGTKHKAYQITEQSEFVYAVKYILIEPCSLREFIEHVLIESMDPPDNYHD